MVKLLKLLIAVFLSFFIFHFFPQSGIPFRGTFSISLYAQPQSCSADKEYEIIPSCVVCDNVLFCYGNNYCLCETDSKIPAPALGSRNGSWYYDSASFPDGIILYNGVTFSVPAGGVYVCDSNVYGCANPDCSGGNGGKVGPIELDISPSLVCSQTIYTASKTVEEPVATPTPAESESESQAKILGLFNLFGTVELPKAKFPDYSLFETVTRQALRPLLPASFQDPVNPNSLNIPQGTLPIKIKHRIEGQDEQDKDDPKKTVSDGQTNASFVPFLAENYALSVLFNPKNGVTKSLNYALPEVEADIPGEGNECVEGGETKDENLSVNDPNPGFSANILEEIVNIIGNIIRKFFKTEVKVESRGYVYGGEKLIEKSRAASSFVPEQFLPDDGASSHQEGTYSISTNIFGSQEKTETLKYQGQKVVYDSYCGLLCSVYPAAFKPKDCECQ